MSTNHNLIYLLLFLSFQISFGQSRAELEHKRNDLLNKIDNISKEINETKKESINSIEYLTKLDDNIATIMDLIANLKSEVSEYNKEISKNIDSLHLLEENKLKLDSFHRNFLKLGYIKKLTTNHWLTFLSSSTLNEGILRYRYAKHINDYIFNNKRKLEKIEKRIVAKNEILKKVTAHKEKLLDIEKENIQKIKYAKLAKKKILSLLQFKEKKLYDKISMYKLNIKSLNQKIESIIYTELNKKKSKTSQPKKSNKRETKFAWPTKEKNIISYFGKQAHRTIQNLEVENNGIDIKIKNDSTIKAVANGQVVGIATIPGFNKMIIISHENDYYSVYSKIIISKVKKGQHISKGSTIGTINIPGTLHFEIWQNKRKINPLEILE